MDEHKICQNSVKIPISSTNSIVTHNTVAQNMVISIFIIFSITVTLLNISNIAARGKKKKFFYLFLEVDRIWSILLNSGLAAILFVQGLYHGVAFHSDPICYMYLSTLNMTEDVITTFAPKKMKKVITTENSLWHIYYWIQKKKLISILFTCGCRN
jgi:hypothetical protein